MVVVVDVDDDGKNDVAPNPVDVGAAVVVVVAAGAPPPKEIGAAEVVAVVKVVEGAVVLPKGDAIDGVEPNENDEPVAVGNVDVAVVVAVVPNPNVAG